MPRHKKVLSTKDYEPGEQVYYRHGDGSIFRVEVLKNDSGNRNPYGGLRTAGYIGLDLRILEVVKIVDLNRFRVTPSEGLKFGVTSQNEWIPQTAVVVQGSTPVSGGKTDTHLAATYAAGWTLSNGWIWDSSLRFSTGSEGDDRFNVWCPSTVLKVPIGPRWKAHMEYFAIFSEGRERESTQHFISPGAHYLITSDWEVGARFGWGLNDQSPNFFVNIGGGYRY